MLTQSIIAFLQLVNIESLTDRAPDYPIAVCKRYRSNVTEFGLIFGYNAHNQLDSIDNTKLFNRAQKGELFFCHYCHM